MKTFPGYFKYFILLSSLVLTGYVLMLGKSILSPILAALIIALLLRPLSARMERLKASRGVSSILSIVIVICILAGFFYFISTQVGNISSDMNSIGARFSELIDRGYGWMEGTFGINQQEQTLYIKDSLDVFMQNSSSAFTQIISATADFFTSFFLFLITLFFILYYRKFFMAFLYKWFKVEDHSVVGSTLYKIELVVRSYILGLFSVILIVAILNSVGLMLLGIQHAVFFGVLASVLTIIPFIGIFIGSLLPILFALVTKDSLWYPVGVAGLFWGIQFLEGNFITPNVVGGRVSINPFAAILALFFGGMVWGALGMILSIPVLAIVKVICDAIKPLQPFGFLLGTPPDEAALHHKKIYFPGIIKKSFIKIKV